MSRLAQDGTAEPVSADQIFRRERGQGTSYFPCSADHEQDWQPYPVDSYSAIYDDHTYIRSTLWQEVQHKPGKKPNHASPSLFSTSVGIQTVWSQPGKVANPTRGQLKRESRTFPCPRSRLRIWSPETGSAVPSRVSLLIPVPRLNLALTYGIPPEFRGGVLLFI